MIKGAFFILFFYSIGELFSLLIGHYIPGNIIGMFLLFLSLYLKIINPRHIKETASVITKNMAIFFIPATVGIMEYTQLLSNYFVAIFFSITISTILIIITVALIQNKFERLSNE